MSNDSPRLKEIMAEIKAVLEKHDVAGYVLLHEPGFSEHIIGVTPTWATLRYSENKDGIGLSMRARKEDYKSAAEQQEAIANTVNMVAHMSHVLSGDAKLFAQLRDAVEGNLEVEHTGGIHTPHREH